MTLKIFVTQVHIIIVHERYNPAKFGVYSNDIAVVILQKEVKLTKFALPVCINWQASPPFSPEEDSTGQVIQVTLHCSLILLY